MERDGEFSSEGEDRTYASAPLANSSWLVVLTQSSDDLYAGLSSTVEWLILVALAVAGLFALAALWRTTRATVQVATANDRLEEANAELARSNLELQRSNSELEQFASVASHDLQEPLRKVQTFGDQLERRFGEDIPEEGLDYLRRMRKAAGRMSVLIDDLLRFSRVTTRALPPERVDLARVSREVVSDLEAAIAETHADVRIGRMPTVEADPSQMRQLLQNLIINGVKFHRPGVPPEIAIEEVPAERGFVAFEVRDNGIGIEPEYQDRIFRVFERLHPRDVYEGTGIGLALCRKIAERHGGTVEVASTPGEGATFRVTFPLRAAAAPPAAPAMPVDEPQPWSPAGV
jgi:light-regulated signal transduction histidine kinase (bacteriophytochrome)